jgi:putative phosphoesterase
VLHVGDLVAASVLGELRELGPPVAAVHGNMDEVALQEELPARLVVAAEGLCFGLVHSGGTRAGRHRRLRAWFPDCDVVGYGHSHEPEITRCDDVWIVNPGSPTDRRRAPTRTMIVVREGKPELVELGVA